MHGIKGPEVKEERLPDKAIRIKMQGIPAVDLTKMNHFNGIVVDENGDTWVVFNEKGNRKSIENQVNGK